MAIEERLPRRVLGVRGRADGRLIDALQLHLTDGTDAGLVRDDLRMHGALVFALRGCGGQAGAPLIDVGAREIGAGGGERGEQDGDNGRAHDSLTASLRRAATARRRWRVRDRRLPWRVPPRPRRAGYGWL